MPRKKIKLITLDLDDTLWPNKKVIVDAERAWLNFIHLKFPDLNDEFNEDSLTRIKVDLVEVDPSLRNDLTRFRKEIIKEALLRSGIESVDAIYYSNESFNEFFKVRNKVQLYAGVKKILERLYRKVTIGALSNGNADLEIIGISDFFKFNLTSKDVKSNKPSPPHFLKALELANCEAEEALHIGDCPVNDIGGARNCNFNTIWFNYDKNKWDEIFPCDLQAKSWNDLYQTINKNFILEKNNV